MPNHLLMHLAGNQRVRTLVETTSLTQPVVRRFVAGETLAEAVAAARGLKAQGIGTVLDYLGENVTDDAQADAATEAYLRSLERIGALSLDAHVSVKLTQLGLDLSFERAVDRLRRICTAAAAARSTVAMDMESHEYTDRTLEAYRILRPGSDRLVLCLQAALKRTEDDAASLLAIKPAIRLVKGAYDEPDDLAYGHWRTMASYRRLLATLLAACDYTAVATHDDLCITEALRLVRRHRIAIDRLEFQMLYGVRRDLQAVLVEQGFKVRVYVPFGAQWYPYLMRRMAERPANLRLFVEALVRG